MPDTVAHTADASGPEHAKWSPVLREFLMPLTAGLG